MCYKSNRSKQFAWDICGETMINNLLKANDNTIHYPCKSESEGQFIYGGENFEIKTKVIGGDDNDYT
jgi:hypothetical protein